MIGTIFFFLLAFIAGIGGAMAIAAATTIMHQIFGATMLVLAGVLLVGAVLCSIETKVVRMAALLQNLRDDADRRDRTHQGFLDERWEMLAASLEKIERLDASTASQPQGFAPEADVKARCFQCGKNVKAKADWAGRTGKCPNCGTPVTFPTISGD
ncbi:MAG: hypothetical protein IT425_10565 [Pirellulales bacterium]|nr:hypothetical protein [Pirellulales bacterium]